MGTKKWSLTTARVLNRLRKVSNEILDGQPTEYERACVNRVWPFVGVERREYPANGLWENIKPQDRRDGVRRQLETRFSEGAFAREGKAAREAFTPDDLLAWGDQLLAEDAANAAVADAELEEEALRLFAPEEHEGGEAAEAAANAAAVAFNQTQQESDTSAGGLAAAGSFAGVGATPEAGTGGDVADPVTDGSLAGSSVEVSPARSQDSEDEDEDDLSELERLLAIKERTYGPDSKEVAITLHDLGLAHGELGDHAKKRGVLERALPIVARTYGNDSAQVAGVLNNLGIAYGNLGDYAKARDVLEPALAIVARTYDNDSAQVAGVLRNLGIAYGRLGDHAKHQKVLVCLLAINERTYDQDHAAVVLVRKKLVELEKEHGLDHPDVATADPNTTRNPMSEDTGTWTCSGSVKNVSKCSWRSRSRDGSSRGGERRSCLRSGPASLDHFAMDPDLANSESWLDWARRRWTCSSEAHTRPDRERPARKVG